MTPAPRRPLVAERREARALAARLARAWGAVVLRQGVGAALVRAYRVDTDERGRA